MRRFIVLAALAGLCGGEAVAQTTLPRQQDTILDWKDSVRVATTAALAANTISGTIITVTANGACASIDGVSLALHDPVLIKDEVAGAKRGLYRVLSLGGVSSQCKFARRADADSSPELTSGLAVFVEEGTTNGGRTYQLTTAQPITLGTTALTFTQLGGTVAGVVSGPGSSTDEAIARFNGTGGTTLQNSEVTISDSGNVVMGAGDTVDGRDLSVDGARLDGFVGSTTDEAICRFNGTSGATQNSAVTIADTTGNISLPALSTVDGRDLSVDGARLDLFDSSTTDDALVRFNGTLGGTQDCEVTCSDTGNLVMGSADTVDGRDISTDGSTLDALAPVVTRLLYPVIVEDWFVGAAGQFGANNMGLASSVIGTGTSFGAIAGELNHPGVMQFSTGTVNNGRAAVGSAADGIRLQGNAWFEAVVRIPTLSDANERFFVEIGTSDTYALGTTPVDGIHFFYTDNVSSGAWVCRSTAASGGPSTAVGSAVVGATWYKLRWELDSGGTLITCYVDGVSIGTINANIPTGATHLVGLVFKIQKNGGAVGTTARTLDSDYIALYPGTVTR